VTKHECSLEVFDELEDYLYRSLHRIFSLCRSKKLSEARLQDFAFTDNPNNCEHCTFKQLCVEKASLRFPTKAVETLRPRRERTRKTLPLAPQPTLF
jgi:predicted metal-binding protein